MMKPEEVLEKYAETFGEEFPLMIFKGTPTEELIDLIQKAIESGKPVEIPEDDSDYPPVYQGVLTVYTYSNARKNAEKVADAIYGLHLKPEALDDGEFYIFPWEEETEEIPICVHKKMGGICLYDPDSHPAFKDAVVVH